MTSGGVPENLLARFIASMTITYEMWHDGDGYDLVALRGLTEIEKDEAEKILLAHAPRDWRDIEALAELNTPAAREEIEKAKKSSDPKVRREAALHGGPLPDGEREKALIRALETASVGAGLTEAIDEAAEFHPPAVIDALFRGALTARAESAVHYAALLFYLHGKSGEPFDWSHRSFFLRFNATGAEERRAAFRELCAQVGVDAARYL